MRRRLKWVVAGVVGLAVLIPLGTFVFVHVVEGSTPARLSLSSIPATTGASATDPVTGTAAGDLTGAWRPTSASQVGYRVKEILFGQSHVAVGRTNKVSGTLAISGDTVTGVDLSVDMASVASDQDRRDNQFRGRIMDVATYPTAMFKLAAPIRVPSTAGSTTVALKATGTLTLHGTTKRVTIDLEARRNGATIEVNGLVPITFADWGIPNPSFGPISTDDHGELELLVVFARAV